jgi:hypothetical protein
LRICPGPGCRSACHHRYLGSRHQLQSGSANCGKYANLLRPQQRAARQNHLSGSHLLATFQHILARFDARIPNAHAAVRQQLGPLNLNHRFRALWDRRPCHDPRRRARTYEPARRLARHDLFNYRQRGAPVRKIGNTDRVAIHHRFVEWRHIQIAGNILGQHVAESITQRSGNRWKRASMFENRGLGSRDGDHVWDFSMRW